MNKLCSFLTTFRKEENGQDLVEYSLLLAFIALGSIALVTGTGTTVKNVWTRINTNLVSGAS
jgi:Flp pilus assembly pilin Flp